MSEELALELTTVGTQARRMGVAVAVYAGVSRMPIGRRPPRRTMSTQQTTIPIADFLKGENRDAPR